MSIEKRKTSPNQVTQTQAHQSPQQQTNKQTTKTLFLSVLPITNLISMLQGMNYCGDEGGVLVTNGL